MPGPADLPSYYAEALNRHLTTPDATTVAQARALGDATVDAHGCISDLAAAHHHALIARRAKKALDPGQLEAAGAFLIAALEPFEDAVADDRAANDALRLRHADVVRAKDALEAAHRELESFSYSVSHDLRAPLRAIVGFSAALEADNATQLDAAGLAHLRRVRETAANMTAIIDDLLRLARMSRAELVRESVDVVPIARRTLEQLRRDEPNRSVEATLPDALVVFGDRRLLEAAIENLLSNAWKFSAHRPVAHLQIGEVAGDRVYFVRDDGVGFDMLHAGQLFGAFQRLHTQAEFKGTGVGLATVQRIIKRHGGRIWAEAAPDVGATFFFTLGE